MVTDKHLIVIVGPTAVGKTAIAIQVARLLNTEVISADSRQIYKETTIGTAKPTLTEMEGVVHHFVDSHSIKDDYDAAQFGRDALQTIENILQEKKFAILCGGSGLYIKAVCEGFDDIPEVDESIRENLVSNYEQHGLAWLQQQMEALDSEHFANIDQQNPHRLIRALEVKIGTGRSISEFRSAKKINHNFNIIKIGLELPREELYQRIDLRMDLMIKAGLFDEARSLYAFKNKNALQTVGYQEVFDFIDHQYEYEEAVRLLKRNSRRYAKRQLTWFKRDHEIRWFSPFQLHEIVTYIQETAK